MSITTLLQRGHNDASKMNFLVKFIRRLVIGFNSEKYWKRRLAVVDPSSKTNTLVKLYYLLYCKKIEARYNSSMGTVFNGGATFASAPKMPHGMNGIVVGHAVRVGKNVTIFHHVTISDGWGG